MSDLIRMSEHSFRQWIHNTCSACEERGAQGVLMDFFDALGLGEEFDHAWQHGVFDDWTWDLAAKRLEELVDVVRFGRY